MRITLLVLILSGCVMEMWRPEEPWKRIEPVPAAWEAEYQWTWDNCGSRVVETPVMPFSGLSFFSVQADGDVFHVRGVEATGFWQWNEIWLLADAVSQVLPVVRSHEYLHAQIGGPGHPPIFAECYAMLLSTVVVP